MLSHDDLVIAVCDNAHEELPAELPRLHWSVSDPARTPRTKAFDSAVHELTERIERLAPTCNQREKENTMTDDIAAAHPHLHLDLSIDQQLALKTAATQLQKEFGEMLGVETIERFLHSSYDQFAGRASIPNFLPLLAERFTRQRLRALARVEGKHHDGKPTVLFLCTHNAGRSQMAMGFFTQMAGDAAVAWSGGSEPGNEVNPAAVQAMAERGIDIAHEYPKPWTDEIVRAADVIITMGCGDACPVFPGRRYEEWKLDDPAGQSVEDVRPIRDEIERRVRALLAELAVPINA